MIPRARHRHRGLQAHGERPRRRAPPGSPRLGRRPALDPPSSLPAPDTLPALLAMRYRASPRGRRAQDPATGARNVARSSPFLRGPGAVRGRELEERRCPPLGVTNYLSGRAIQLMLQNVARLCSAADYRPGSSSRRRRRVSGSPAASKTLATRSSWLTRITRRCTPGGRAA